MDDQIIKLILQITGTNDVAELQTKLGGVASTGPAAAAALGSIEASATQAGASAARAAADVGKVGTAADRAGKATKEGGKSASNAGLGFLELARAVEDAQYGFRGVVNNIPNMVMLFGGSAGLAAALNLTAVGINILLPRLGELWQTLQGEAPRVAADQIKTLEARVKDLSEQPMRLRVEQVELDEAKKKLDALKKGLAEYEAGLNKQNVHEAEAGKVVDETLTESRTGRAAIEEKMRAQVESRDLANSVTIRESQAAAAKARADLEYARKILEESKDLDERRAAIEFGGEAQKKLTAATLAEQDARNKIAEAAKAEVGGVIARARTGHGRDQAEAIADLARRLRSVGEGAVAADVAGTSAEGLRLGDQADEEFNRRMERARTAGAARREKAAREKKAANDLTDQLNTQGAQNEKAALAELAQANKEQGKDEASLIAESKRNFGAIEAEQKRIQDTVGKQYQARYEALLASNAANAAQGLPSMDPAKLKAQLQNEMFAMMRQRGAGEQSARLATGAIGKAGDQDLTQRMTQFGGHGLNLAAQTLMLTRQLRSELDHMDMVQKQLIAEARAQGRRSRPGSRTNAKH